MFEHTAKDTSQGYNPGFDKIQGEISHYFKPLMPGLKPTGASIGRSSAAITCVLLCKKPAWGIAVSKVHNRNHIHHLHLFFFLEKTCDGYDGYVSVRKRNYGFSTWRVMHALFWHLSTSRQFSESNCQPVLYVYQPEVCRWDNLCLHFLSVKETDICTSLHLGVVTVEPVFNF